MNEYWGQYWGEMPAMADMGPGIIAVERAEMSRVGPLTVHPSRDNYPLTQLSNGEDTDDKSAHVGDHCLACDVAEVSVGSPVMLHTIRLLRLLRQLNENNVKNELTRDSVPQLIQTNDKQINGFNVSELKGKALNSKAVKALLRRAVVIIIVFYGYDYTNESVIDLLVDILSEYLLGLCQTIRTTTDSSELRSSNDFIDVIDRVFHDLNVPDFESLRQYDSDLNNYNQNLMKEVMRKIGINESMNGTTQMSTDFSLALDSNCDNSPQVSTNTESESKEVEPTLSLKSLLSSYKSDETQENEQFFGLTSPAMSVSLKSVEN